MPPARPLRDVRDTDPVSQAIGYLTASLDSMADQLQEHRQAAERHDERIERTLASLDRRLADIEAPVRRMIADDTEHSEDRKQRRNALEAAVALVGVGVVWSKAGDILTALHHLATGH